METTQKNNQVLKGTPKSFIHTVNHSRLKYIIVITITGTAEWERARLYRVNRPTLDHVRLKKRSEKLKWSTEQKTIYQRLKAANTHATKDRIILIIPLINKNRNERPSILVRPMTNTLQSKLMKSLSASRKSITLKENRKARKQSVTDLITNLIQHTKPCNRTTIIQAIRYNIIDQLRTSINDSIQHSQMADCCRAPHYRSILQYGKHKASETMLPHFS